MIHQESIHLRRSHVIIENLAISDLHIQIANDYGLDAGAWYESREVSRLLTVPSRCSGTIAHRCRHATQKYGQISC